MRHAAWICVLVAGCQSTGRHPAAAPPPPAAPEEVVVPGRTAVLLHTSGGLDPVLLAVACFDAGTRTFIAGDACVGLVPHDAHLAQGVTVTGAADSHCREHHQRALATAQPRRLTGEYLLWPATLQVGLVRPQTQWPSGPEPQGPDKMFRALPPMIHPEPSDAERALVEAAVGAKLGRSPGQLEFEYDVYPLDLDGDGQAQHLIGANVRASTGGDSLLGVLYWIRAGAAVEIMASPLHRVWGLVGLDLDGDGHRELVLDLLGKRGDPDEGAELVVRLSGPRPEVVARFQPCPPAPAK